MTRWIVPTILTVVAVAAGIYDAAARHLHDWRPR